MTKSRKEMIAHIAEEWVNDVDTRHILREIHREYIHELDTWSESRIEKEYKKLTDKKTPGALRLSGQNGSSALVSHGS